MPRYTVTDPVSRRTVTLTGDSEPTEEELNQIFDEIGKTQPKQEPGFMDKAKSGFDAITSNPAFQAVQSANPISVAKKVYDTGVSAFDKGGTMAAEKLGEMGVNPNVSAGVGTAIAMAPDLASAVVPGGPGLKGSAALESGAQGFARRALGFSKRQLGTPFAREQANQAAKVALDEGVLPLLGNRDVMAQRAIALKDKAGNELGNIRDSAGPQPVDDVFNNLEALREQVVKGRTGGVWDDINNRINKAQESILGLLNRNGKVPLADIEETKKAISDTVNYASDKASQKGTKRIVSAIENGVEQTLSKNGADMTAYKSAKTKYGAAKNMLSAIDNASSAERGNNLIGPTAAISGIAQAAAGNPGAAAAQLGIIELLKRRGSSGVANLLNYIAPQATVRKSITSPLMNLISASLTRRGDSR